MATLNVQSGGYLIIGVPSLRAFDASVDGDAYSLTGTAAPLVLGKRLVAGSGSYTLTGTSITISKLTAAPGAYTVQGQTVTLRLNNRKIIASNGSYAVTGTTATRLELAKRYTNGAYSITGTAVTFSVASLPKIIIPATGTYTITGVSAVLFAELPIDSGDYNITGSAVFLRPGKRIVANSGTYNIVTAVPVLLKRSHINIVDGTTYSITGLVANLNLSSNPFKFIIADAGSYSYTGFSQTLRRLNGLSADTTTFTVTGTDAALRTTFKFPATSDSYSVTGTDVTLLRSITSLPADSGTYSISSGTTLVYRTITLVAQSRVYAYTGTSATLRYTQKALSGTYNLSGSAINFRHTVILTANSNTYTINGTLATLLFPVRLFNAGIGTYSITGYDQLVVSSPTITLLAGSYTLTGNTVELRVTHIDVDNGHYQITGFPVNLIPSHTGRWRKQPARGPRFNKQPPQSTTWDQQPVGPGVL